MSCSLAWVYGRRRLAATVGGLLLLALAAFTSVVQAQGPADVPPLTLDAGQSQTVSIRAFCLEYNKLFPRVFPPIGGQASPRQTDILRYSLSRGYPATAPYQVQLALWYDATGRWVNNPHVIGSEIIANANQAPPAPGGLTLLDAMRAGVVTVSYSDWRPITAGLPDSNPPWLGAGNITITNTTGAPVTMWLSQGLRLNAPPANQDMIVYFPSPTPTVTGTPTRPPTATPPPTQTPTPPLPPTGSDDPQDRAALLILLGAIGIAVALGLDIVRRRREVGL